MAYRPQFRVRGFQDAIVVNPMFPQKNPALLQDFFFL